MHTFSTFVFFTFRTFSLSLFYSLQLLFMDRELFIWDLVFCDDGHSTKRKIKWKGKDKRNFEFRKINETKMSSLRFLNFVQLMLASGYRSFSAAVRIQNDFQTLASNFIFFPRPINYFYNLFRNFFLSLSLTLKFLRRAIFVWGKWPLVRYRYNLLENWCYKTWFPGLGLWLSW